MDNQSPAAESHVEMPSHPLPRRYIEPIIYLAARMASMDKKSPAPEVRVVEELADSVHLTLDRDQRWFRRLNDDAACDRLDMETVKKGALVVLSLVMKADTNRGEEAKAYFSKIRKMLHAEPVAVPVELEEHKELALRYLRD